MSKEEKRVKMLSMIADWQQTGLSKKRYCEENGISEATFYCFSCSKENDTSSNGFIAMDKTGRKGAVEVWILRFDLCQSFRSDDASCYGSKDAILV